MSVRFRNVSGETRIVLDAVGGPREVGDDELFDVPDDRADAVAKQPYFTREDPEPTVKTKTAKGGD